MHVAIDDKTRIIDAIGDVLIWIVKNNWIDKINDLQEDMTAREARREKADEWLLHCDDGRISVEILKENVFSHTSTSVNVSASKPNEKRRISSCDDILQQI